MFHLIYSVLLGLILSINHFNFAVTAGHDEFNTTSANSMRGNLSYQETEENEEDEILNQELRKKIKYYKKKKKESKELKKLKIRLGELVLEELKLKQENNSRRLKSRAKALNQMQNARKQPRSQVDSQAWSEPIFCGLCTLASVIFWIYKFHANDESFSDN